MLPKEFESFIRSGDIHRVTISRPNVESAWSIAGHGKTLPADVLNTISLDQKGRSRLWADLDAAYGFIRKSGFSKSIEIDG
jgi:hypothetical protein